MIQVLRETAESRSFALTGLWYHERLHHPRTVAWVALGQA